MKELLLLRHAKSSWKFPELDDHDRPLNKRGRRTAPRMGELLLAEDLVPDLILSSTARRAQHTATLVAEACKVSDDEIQLTEDLYEQSVSGWLTLLQELPRSVRRVLLVAHNPSLEEFLLLLTGVEEILPTAALCSIKLRIETWDELTTNCGKLIDLWRPKELEA